MAAKAEREVEAWNAKHPTGTRVRYWRYLGPAVRLDVKIATARGVQ